MSSPALLCRWTNINPNYPVPDSTANRIPLEPMCADAGCEGDSISLAAVGGATGILFSAAQVYSPYGGSIYGTVTSYTSGAPYAEGDTFDECGCHGSRTDRSTYHCHVPPTCLLKQLGAVITEHSPQIGWSFE